MKWKIEKQNKHLSFLSYNLVWNRVHNMSQGRVFPERSDPQVLEVDQSCLIYVLQ